MSVRSAAFQRLLNLAKDVLPGALTSGGLTGGLALMQGASPLEAGMYGVADAAASGLALGGVRALRPKSPMRVIDTRTGKETLQPGTSRLELPANIAASILTGTAVSNLLGGGTPANTDALQAQQIMQENIQRDFLNEQLANRLAQVEGNRANVRNAYSPGTMFQLQGAEHTLPMAMAMREELYRPDQFNLAGLQRDMSTIMGV